MLLWGDPETAKGEMAPELLELQKHAQGIMMERPLPRGTALSGGSKSHEYLFEELLLLIVK